MFYSLIIRWDKLFKNGPNKICGRQPLKDLKGAYDLIRRCIPLQILKAVFHRFFLVHIEYFVLDVKSKEREVNNTEMLLHR